MDQLRGGIRAHDPGIGGLLQDHDRGRGALPQLRREQRRGDRDEVVPVALLPGELRGVADRPQDVELPRLGVKAGEALEVQDHVIGEARLVLPLIERLDRRAVPAAAQLARNRLGEMQVSPGGRHLAVGGADLQAEAEPLLVLEEDPRSRAARWA